MTGTPMWPAESKIIGSSTTMIVSTSGILDGGGNFVIMRMVVTIGIGSLVTTPYNGWTGGGKSYIQIVSEMT